MSRDMVFQQYGILTGHSIFNRQAKALFRLYIYTGWSEPLLVAHPTLLKI